MEKVDSSARIIIYHTVVLMDMIIITIKMKRNIEVNNIAFFFFPPE
ncbi:MAG TPA: hypothetical protein GX505_12040 [Clostridiales bacterium]|nr:hypothetical protein [Clostridiales bacterium]